MNIYAILNTLYVVYADKIQLSFNIYYLLIFALFIALLSVLYIQQVVSTVR